MNPYILGFPLYVNIQGSDETPPKPPRPGSGDLGALYGNAISMAGNLPAFVAIPPGVLPGGPLIERFHLRLVIALSGAVHLLTILAGSFNLAMRSLDTKSVRTGPATD